MLIYVLNMFMLWFNTICNRKHNLCHAKHVCLRKGMVKRCLQVRGVHLVRDPKFWQLCNPTRLFQNIIVFAKANRVFFESRCGENLVSECAASCVVSVQNV